MFMYDSTSVKVCTRIVGNVDHHLVYISFNFQQSFMYKSCLNIQNSKSPPHKYSNVRFSLPKATNTFIICKNLQYFARLFLEQESSYKKCHKSFLNILHEFAQGLQVRRNQWQPHQLLASYLVCTSQHHQHFWLDPYTTAPPIFHTFRRLWVTFHRNHYFNLHICQSTFQCACRYLHASHFSIL